MKIYRDKFFNRKTGQRESARKWTIEFRFKGRRKLVGFKDKTASEQLGRKLERLAALRSNSDPPTAELAEWIAHLPARMRDRLERMGILDSRRLAASRPLLKNADDGTPGLLHDFKESLLSRGGTERHAIQTAGRVRRVFNGCGFE